MVCYFYHCYGRGEQWLWNGLPRRAEHSIAYLWLTSFAVDWLERAPTMLLYSGNLGVTPSNNMRLSFEGQFPGDFL